MILNTAVALSEIAVVKHPHCLVGEVSCNTISNIVSYSNPGQSALIFYGQSYTCKNRGRQKLSRTPASLLQLRDLFLHVGLVMLFTMTLMKRKKT